MMRARTLLMGVVVVVFCFVRGGNTDSVKYDDLGTFYYYPGTNNCHHWKPEDPAAISTKFRLYTQSTSNKIIDRKSADSIHSSYNGNKNTYFIIHGWTDKYTSWYFQDIKTDLINKENGANVIMVDWQIGAGRANYAQSRANTRVVGREIAKLIDLLVKETSSTYGRMHIIGHSLGAHTGGYAGESASGNVGHITGLDPAGPEFTGFGNDCKLDKSDGTFVDAIHTDGQTGSNPNVPGAGLMDALGHQDFYPNGGKKQPGCPNPSNVLSCDHMRAVYYYLESIANSCTFTADQKCDSNMNCWSCGSSCPKMGYNAVKSAGSGRYSLTTTSSAPYCK